MRLPSWLRGRPLLALALLGVVVTAALGLYAVVAGSFGETGGRLLGTSASATAAMVLLLGCLAIRERRSLHGLPLLGAALSVALCAMLVIAIWVDFDSDDFGIAILSVLLVDAWAILGSVLGLARLAPRFRRVFPGALLFTGVAFAMGLWALWFGVDGGVYWRVCAGFSILGAALAATVMILARVSRDELAAGSGEQAGARFCPACGAALAEPGAGSCTACRARFRVRLLT